MPDTNVIHVMGAEIVRQSNTLTFNDVKLQTLDRRVGADQLVFDRDMFAKSLNDWENIPVIFQKDGIHPEDFPAVEENPSAAAEAIGGRLVGRVHSPRIVIEGGARLMATISIDENEQEIEDLWQKGLLFPSTAFSVNSDGDRITSPPIPNHVLIFPMEVDKVIPGDPGAYLNTLEVSESMTESAKECEADVQVANAGKLSFYEWIEQTVNKILSKKKCSEEVVEESKEEQTETACAECGCEKPAETCTEEVANETNSVDTASEVGEESKEVENSSNLSEQEEQHEVGAEGEVMNSANLSAESTETTETPVELKHTEEIKALQSELASMKEQVQQMNAMKEELEKYRTAEKEALNTELLQSMPCGMVATEELKNSVIAQFESDPRGLLLSVLKQLNTNCVTTKVGSQYTFSEVTNNQPFVSVGDLSKKGN